MSFEVGTTEENLESLWLRMARDLTGYWRPFNIFFGSSRTIKKKLDLRDSHVNSCRHAQQDPASKARQLSCHVPSGSREQAPGQHHGLCNLTSKHRNKTVRLRSGASTKITHKSSTKKCPSIFLALTAVLICRCANIQCGGQAPPEMSHAAAWHPDSWSSSDPKTPGRPASLRHSPDPVDGSYLGSSAALFSCCCFVNPPHFPVSWP